MTFYVGQTVEKFRALPNDLPHQEGGGMKVGDCAVIREVDDRTLWLFGTATLRFVGQFGPIQQSCFGSWEIGYAACCFRPIVETKTDISIFAALLNPTPVERKTARETV